MTGFKDWVQDVQVTNTLGNGWCVHIDGSDVFDEINIHGVKTRRTLSIAPNLESKEVATDVAIKWLENQLSKVKDATEANRQ